MESMGSRAMSRSPISSRCFERNPEKVETDILLVLLEGDRCRGIDSKILTRMGTAAASLVFNILENLRTWLAGGIIIVRDKARESVRKSSASQDP